MACCHVSFTLLRAPLLEVHSELILTTSSPPHARAPSVRFAPPVSLSRKRGPALRPLGRYLFVMYRSLACVSQTDQFGAACPIRLDSTVPESRNVQSAQARSQPSSRAQQVGHKPRPGASPGIDRPGALRPLRAAPDSDTARPCGLSLHQEGPGMRPGLPGGSGPVLPRAVEARVSQRHPPPVGHEVGACVAQHGQGRRARS
jgi:hypothetical protein